MRPYELTIIFTTEEELYQQSKAAVLETLKNLGAELVKEEELGEKALAYEIKDKTRGRYVLFVVNMMPDKINEAQKMFKLDKNILKHLFVRVEI